MGREEGDADINERKWEEVEMLSGFGEFQTTYSIFFWQLSGLSVSTLIVSA